MSTKPKSNIAGLEKSRSKRRGETLTLTKKQREAIPIILSKPTITEGVKAAGISSAAFYYWLHEPAFRSEFESQRKEVVEYGLHELKMAVSEAAHVIRELLTSEREGIRIKAACAILEHVSRFMELESVETRLTAIEQQIKEVGNYEGL